MAPYLSYIPCGPTGFNTTTCFTLSADQGPEKRAGERESVPNLPRVVPRPHQHLAIDGQEGREEE